MHTYSRKSLPIPLAPHKEYNLSCPDCQPLNRLFRITRPLALRLLVQETHLETQTELLEITCVTLGFLRFLFQFRTDVPDPLNYMAVKEEKYIFRGPQMKNTL